MQVIERNRIIPKNGFIRERRSRVWPALLLMMAVLAGILWIFGASAALMAAGIGGAVIALASVSAVKRALWLAIPGGWHIVFLLWLVSTLGLCLSFVVSAMTTRRADFEARSTIMALGLAAAWFALTRAKRAGGAYKFAAMIALAEVGRLIALGTVPSFVSYSIWIAAAAVAWRSSTYRRGLSF